MHYKLIFINKLLFALSLVMLLITILEPLSLMFLTLTGIFGYLFMRNLIKQIKRGQLLPIKWRGYIKDGRLFEYMEELQIVRKTPILSYFLLLLKLDKQKCSNVKQQVKQQQLKIKSQQSNLLKSSGNDPYPQQYQLKQRIIKATINKHKRLQNKYEEKILSSKQPTNKSKHSHQYNININQSQQYKEQQKQIENLMTNKQKQLQQNNNHYHHLGNITSTFTSKSSHSYFSLKNTKQNVNINKTTLNKINNIRHNINGSRQSVLIKKIKSIQQQQQQQQQQLQQQLQQYQQLSDQISSVNHKTLKYNLQQQPQPQPNNKSNSIQFNTINNTIVNQNSNNSPHNQQQPTTKYNNKPPSSQSPPSPQSVQQSHPLKTAEQYLQALIWMMKRLLSVRKITNKLKRTSIIKLTLISCVLWTVILVQIKIDKKKGKLLFRTLKLILQVITVLIAITMTLMLGSKGYYKLTQGDQKRTKPQSLLYQTKYQTK